VIPSDGYTSRNRLWAAHHSAADGESQPVSSMILLWCLGKSHMMIGSWCAMRFRRVRSDWSPTTCDLTPPQSGTLGSNAGTGAGDGRTIEWVCLTFRAGGNHEFVEDH
jgi:hypothetical protein